MFNRTGVIRILSVAASLAVLSTVGCSNESDIDATGGNSVEDPAASAAEVATFCTAVKALDRTDGTTDDGIVLQVLSDMRRTAPQRIKDDVIILSNSLIINEYPSGVTPSMKKAPLDQVSAAGERLAAFVEDNCDLDEEPATTTVAG